MASHRFLPSLVTFLSLVSALVGSRPHADAATNPATKCKAAIVTAAAAFIQQEAAALQRCEGAKVKGVLPRDTVCATEPLKTQPAIVKARTKLDTAIVKACGGKDKVCGTMDADGSEPSLAAIGWNIAQCPNFGGGDCTNAITDCSGIPSCIQCVSEAALGDALALYYGALTPTDPKSKDKSERARNRCQVTVGKAATTFLLAKSKGLAKCWAAVNKAGSGQCPDAIATTAIAAAESRKRAAIEKGCAGPDRRVGTPDDETPATIGFVGSCTDVTVPGGTPCIHAVEALGDLVDCVDCVTEFAVDCANDAAVPAFVPTYPTECNAAAPSTSTPTPTATPTPATPGSTATSGTPGATSTPSTTPTPGGFNTVFVTSTLHPANFGSATAADAICQTIATGAGLIGTYVAWVSDANSAAPSRLGAARGFVRPDGQPFADAITDIEAGKIFNPLRLDENGNSTTGSTTVWTGINRDGTLATDTCLNWTSIAMTDSALTGRNDGGPVAWTARTNNACVASRRLYCFQTDFTTPLTPTPTTGKRAFYSVGGLTPGPTTGITAADAFCANEAAAAGLSGAYMALLATSTASAISRFPTAATSTYVRPDGIVIAAGTTLAAGNALQSGIWQHADGTYAANSNAWTGATTPSVAGSALSTCNDWGATTSMSGIGGPVTLADSFWWNGFTNGDCTQPFRVYCLEE